MATILNRLAVRSVVVANAICVSAMANECNNVAQLVQNLFSLEAKDNQLGAVLFQELQHHALVCPKEVTRETLKAFAVMDDAEPIRYMQTLELLLLEVPMDIILLDGATYLSKKTISGMYLRSRLGPIPLPEGNGISIRAMYTSYFEAMKNTDSGVPKQLFRHIFDNSRPEFIETARLLNDVFSCGEDEKEAVRGCLATLGKALILIQKGNVRTPEVQSEVEKALDRLMESKQPWISYFVAYLLKAVPLLGSRETMNRASEAIGGFDW